MSIVRSSCVRSVLLAALLTVLLAPVALAQEADLIVLKTGPDQANADADVTYNIVLMNGGPDDATAVTLTDPIPPGMTFVSESHDPAFNCTDPGVGGTGPVSCTSVLFATGATANFSFVFHINPSTPPGTTFSNTVTVTEPTDPSDENNSSTAVTSTPPPPQSDLGIIKTGPSVTGVDTDVTYTITFFNGGPDDAATGSWSDNLPGTMTFVSLTQNSGPGMVCTDPGAGTGGTVSCSRSPFAAGASASFTLVTHVPAGTLSGTSFTNVATVSGGDDPNPENNTSQTGLVVSTVDIAMTKTGPPSTTAGNNVSYTITITNNGPDTASNVSLTDDLPPGTTFVLLSQDSGTAPTGCGTPLVGTNGTVTCTFVSLVSGAAAQFTLTLNSGTAASISNTVTGASDSFDTNPSNNSATANTTVAQSADLSVTKNGPGAATAGNNVTYQITVSNAGPSDAASVTLADTLPANTTFVSVNQTSGPTFNCTGGSPTTCTIALLAPGASASFDLVANVSSSAPTGSSITNTATVSAATPDPNNTNDSATSPSMLVSTSADLVSTKNGPAAVAPDTDISYTVTIANNGPSDALSAQIIDTPPPTGTTFVSGTQTSGPAFTCGYPAPGANSSFTCTSNAPLVPGASASFTFVLHVDPTATISIMNTATATSGTLDPVSTNNAASSLAIVSAATTDLSITKTANGTRFPAGSNVTYTIVATNNGPALATNVVVTDIIPPGTTFVSATPSQGSCTGTTTVTCNAGLLAPGSAVTMTLVVTLPSTFGPVTNTATVTADNADSNPANNSGSAVLAVASEIPSLSPLALALLALGLAVVGIFVTRMR